MNGALEAATRLIRDLNGRNIDLPEAQLADIREVCQEILRQNDPTMKAVGSGTLFSSQMARWP